MSRLRLKTLAPLLTEHGCTPSELVSCCQELVRPLGTLHAGSGCTRSVCPNPPANECQALNDWIVGPWGGMPDICINSNCLTGCCFPNQSCENLTQNKCGEAGGTPERWLCSKPGLCAGACCLPFDSSDAQSGSRCTTAFESGCLDAGGTFFDTGSECNDSIECLTGCCHGPVGERLCTDMTGKQCADIPGSIRKSVLCAADPCVNFCCRPSGVCSEMTGADCAEVGGQVQGIDCGEGLCEIKGCCPPDGVPGACEDITVAACTIRGWVVQELLCEQVSCNPIGCCLPDDTCENVPKQECLDRGGDPQTTLCTSTLCEITGCCCPDGSCSDVTRRECTLAECVPQQVLCVEDPCSEWACCCDGGVCTDLTHRECTLRECNWKRDELCVDGPCDDVCCWCGHCCDLDEGECFLIRGKVIEMEICNRGGSDECRKSINVPKPWCNRGVWKPNVDAIDGAVMPVSDRKVFMHGVASRSHVTHKFNRGRTGFRDDRTDSAAFALVFGQWYVAEPATCRVSICDSVIDENGFAKFVCGYRCGCAPAECAGV